MQQGCRESVVTRSIYLRKSNPLVLAKTEKSSYPEVCQNCGRLGVLFVPRSGAIAALKQRPLPPVARTCDLISELGDFFFKARPAQVCREAGCLHCPAGSGVQGLRRYRGVWCLHLSPLTATEQHRLLVVASTVPIFRTRAIVCDTGRA